MSWSDIAFIAYQVSLPLTAGKGKGTEQLADVIGEMPIIDLGGRLDFGSFTVTAAAMCNLDLIVSCDTSCVHLAGALGRPVWAALSYASEWRWLQTREDSPWYPTMRIFRQARLGDWDGLFEKMAEALDQEVAVRSPQARSADGRGEHNEDIE